MNNFKAFSEAMFSESFPCNPIPFANALAQYVSKNGTESIRSDEAKRILWILMSQCYGSTATINLMDEWYEQERKFNEQNSDVTSNF